MSPPHPQPVATAASADPANEPLDELLRAAELGGRVLAGELERLAERFGPVVYSEFIHLLSHLRFEPAEARRLWHNIAEHADFMQRSLGCPVDPRVALVSYFVEVNRKLKQPKIIELRLFEETRASAYRDELTGLFNYRYFEECLPQEIARAERQGQPVSLVMVDLDDFKPYNDTYGHAAANEALAAIGLLLKDSLRRPDIATRYGGEEFMLILPATSKLGACAVAERLRRTIERYELGTAGSTSLGSLTATMGVATYPGDARDGPTLVKRADRAMYQAKAAGKNRVQLYGDSGRSFGRVRATLGGEFRMLAPQAYSLTTLGVGEGGMHFFCERALGEGSVLDVALQVPGSPCPIRVSAVVLRTERCDDGRYETAVRFTTMTTEDRKRLAEYVRGSRR